MHPYISGCTQDVGGSVGEAHGEKVGSESIACKPHCLGTSAILLVKIYGCANGFKQMAFCSPKYMFLAEYSLLAMFDTYPGKCTTQNMYTCVCAGLVVIVSLRTALGSLKEEEERKKEEKEDDETRFSPLPGSSL